MMSRFFQQLGITRGTTPVASHEFRVSQRVSAVSWAPLGRGWTQRALQRTRDPLRHVAFETGPTIHVEITLSGEARALQMCVKYFQGETPLSFRNLNGAVHYKPDIQAGRDLRG